MKRIIKTTSKINLRLINHNNIDNLQRYTQFKALFIENNAYSIFSEPDSASKAKKKITWFTNIEGNITNYTNLSDPKKELIKGILKEKIKYIFNKALYVFEHDPSNKGILKIIEKAIEIPSLADIYVIEGENNKTDIVLIRWGAIKDDYGAESGIIKSLVPIKIKDILFKIEFKDGTPAINETFDFNVNGKLFQATSDNQGHILIYDIPFWKNIELSQTNENNETINKNSFICDSKNEYIIRIPLKVVYKNMKFVVLDAQGKPAKNQKITFVFDNKKQEYKSNKQGEIILPKLKQNAKIQVFQTDKKGDKINNSNFVCGHNDVNYIKLNNVNKPAPPPPPPPPPPTPKPKPPTPKLPTPKPPTPKPPPPTPVVKYPTPVIKDDKFLKVLNHKRKPVANAKVYFDTNKKYLITNKFGFIDFESQENLLINFKIKKGFLKTKKSILITSKKEYEIILNKPPLLWLIIPIILFFLTALILLFVAILNKKPFDFDCKVFCSDALVTDKYYTKQSGEHYLFLKDEHTVICEEGEFHNIDSLIPGTFDGIAIGTNTRFILYAEKNCTGDIILDTIGPLIINNIRFKDSIPLNEVNTKPYIEPYQTLYPKENRIWSKTDMRDWENGSFKIECINN